MSFLRTVLISCACFGYIFGYNIHPGPLVQATKGEVWPKPQKQERGDGFMAVDPQMFKFHAIKETCKILEVAFERYMKIITDSANSRLRPKQQATPSSRDKAWKDHKNFVGSLVTLQVDLTETCGDNDIPTADMYERYSLHINMPTQSQAILKSKSIWGILRGLETFSQLLYLADDGAALIINSTTIRDHPRFHHRGLLLDTARHYMPMNIILRIIDAMAYNKMNIFHWHIVDDQSFPFQSKTFPELSEKGAYHPEYMIYTPEDVQRVIRYAARRGIRVMPEFDTPGHTRSWGEGRPELLTTCYTNSKPNGYLGPIDPTKNSTYRFMETFFREIVGVFPEQYVHLGGDEVDFDCWQSNAAISQWMADNNMVGDYATLEEYYIQKLVDTVNSLNAKSIVWEEVFANGVELPKETLVHVWLNNDILPNATFNGYKTIWSSCWYLDHLSTGGDWTKYYQCDPHSFFSLPPGQEKLIIGGEACMWAEVVDSTNVIQRIWPRASAVAEKLWSARSVRDLQDAAKRLEEHTCRMNVRGIPAQPPNGAGYFLRSCSRVLLSSNVQRAALSTTVPRYKSKIDDALNLREAPQVSELAVLKPEELKQKKQLEGYITVEGPVDISPISGIPEEHIKTRRVRIYMPAKNAMQSGTDNIHFWQIEFDNRERWENPLMGWASSGDPMSNMKVEFSSKDDAIAYCEKNGWQWFLQESTEKLARSKNYGVNFAWNKRARVSTK
ncbi:fused lobes [Carabus blaptoides fortunei]